MVVGAPPGELHVVRSCYTAHVAARCTYLLPLQSVPPSPSPRRLWDLPDGEEEEEEGEETLSPFFLALLFFCPDPLPPPPL